MPRKMIVIIFAVLLTMVSAGVAHAGDETLWTVATTPDALIILDLTGSMADPPQGSGGTLYVSGSTCNIAPGPFYLTDCDSIYPTNSNPKCTSVHHRACTSGSDNTAHTHYGNTYPLYGTSTCTEPFYTTNDAPHTVRCEKVDIAKYALYALLNDSNTDGFNAINAADMTSLGIRLGLMRYSCGSASADTHYSTDGTSCINLSWPITSDVQTTATPYSSIYCNDATSCASTVTSCGSTPSGKECIIGFSAANNTPLAYSLKEAKLYLDAHKALDDSQSCRQKSVIVVTDGEDTLYNCSGNPGTAAYATARSKASVMYAKQLADAKYNVYVVGFGSTMPTNLQNTLNWMAIYGKTDNPSIANSGSTTAVTVSTAPCTSSNGTDPQTKNLSGYAFMASNPAELSAALRAAITSILEANYSFSSQASVAAARIEEDNFIYEASFEPKNSAGLTKEPFWTGHLKKYQLNAAGGLLTNPLDAGAILRDTAASSRNMWTYKGSGLIPFDTTNIIPTDLALLATNTTRRNEVVGFYRGESAYNLENWKLGDLFHTNPMAVKKPNEFFYDPRECRVSTTPTSFDNFRTAWPRTAADGQQLMLAGANDAQVHAFRTNTMQEAWSFIPPNLLQKIAPMAHAAGSAGPPIVAGHDYSRSALAAHDYYVDGPLQVADVWLGTGSGTSKSAGDWKTIAVFGEGQGSGPSYLWSSSPTCYSTDTTYFSASFSTTLPTTANPTKYYCGFYALDVTNTSTTPVYKWHLMPTTAQAPYLGEAWSKMQIGRIKKDGNEMWVGFIGGGYNNSICGSSDTCNAADGKGAGKGFFVVDLRDGSIIWSYTHASNGAMDFAAPASPLPLDLDGDGFIDTVYMGDLGGNMWRFRLCPRVAYEACGLGSYGSCGTGSWTGSLLYSTTSAERGAIYNSKQIFTKATATKDTAGNVWVYFGTGENNDPTWKPTTIPDTSNTKNRFYGIKEDPNFTATYTTSNLTDITSTSTTYDALTATTHGWYINLSTNPVTPTGGATINSPIGEKMISDPAVFGGIVYFASYVPAQGTATACGLAGNSFLNGIKYLSGAGALGDPNSRVRTEWIGLGIGSSILVSYRPDKTAVDIYATASGGAGTGALTQTLDNDFGNPGGRATSSMTNIIYWKDRRLE